ncbi:DUF3592 domain-containing protein [Nocardioides sp. NPDC087217]|uniref:DUF3592 domain-containing protein n=1 Tax=Nocardioides sp. NPDC087217 TaxID=3364335 RepID=UPI00380FDEEF
MTRAPAAGRSKGPGCLTFALFAPVPFIVFGLVVAYVWFVVTPNNRDLTDYTGHTTAIVTKVVETTGSDIVHYRYEVGRQTYRDSTGTYDAAYPGDKLQVCYVPSKPKKHHVIDFSNLVCGRDNPR